MDNFTLSTLNILVEGIIQEIPISNVKAKSLVSYQDWSDSKINVIIDWYKVKL